ncbi:MAG TPA: DNA polymerase I, partial [Methanoregulaceae archaeon]|nr:DNA polymerase I [Methanoregulaceae archaeon]
GQIEVHEKITWHAREILLTTKECAEEMGFDVLHGIVDCLWVQGGPAGALKARIELVTGLHTTLDCYDWIVFLPMPDGYGAYNRYYGRLSTGDLKIRGIMARRGDTPPYVRAMQEAMLSVMKGAGSRAELASCREEVQGLYREAQSGLAAAAPSSLAIRRQVSQLTYSRSCPEASAIAACRAAGIRVEPGMEIGYVVTDARTWSVELDWLAKRFDQGYYRRLLARAWEEIAFALEQAAK